MTLHINELGKPCIPEEAVLRKRNGVWQCLRPYRVTLPHIKITKEPRTITITLSVRYWYFGRRWVRFTP